jgi:hypothetical protein
VIDYGHNLLFGTFINNCPANDAVGMLSLHRGLRVFQTRHISKSPLSTQVPRHEDTAFLFDTGYVENSH